jgi:hypothetical protein
MASSSDSDTDEIIAIYMYTRKRRQQRRILVHEILQQRLFYGEHHHLVKELHFYLDKSKQYFRMSEQQFDYVLEMVDEHHVEYMIVNKHSDWLLRNMPHDNLPQIRSGGNWGGFSRGQNSIRVRRRCQHERLHSNCS